MFSNQDIEFDRIIATFVVTKKMNSIQLNMRWALLQHSTTRGFCGRRGSQNTNTFLSSNDSVCCYVQLPLVTTILTTCWAHELRSLSPTTFEGPAVALETLQPHADLGSEDICRKSGQHLRQHFHCNSQNASKFYWILNPLRYHKLSVFSASYFSWDLPEWRRIILVFLPQPLFVFFSEVSTELCL